MQRVTGAILAGGKSSRMGSPKALLTINGSTLIERVASVVHAVTDDLLIVSNSHTELDFLPYPIIPDAHHQKCSLTGIYTALVNSSRENVLIAACDLPFLSRAFIEYLLGFAGSADVVVPETTDGIQPLCALYSKTCIEPVRRRLDAEMIKVSDLYDDVRTRRIAIEPTFDFYRTELLFNINSPGDYEHALRLLKAR